MFYRLKDYVRRWVFNNQIREVLRIGPVKIDQCAKAVVLTQLQHKDVKMFLLACKTFSARIPISKVYILSDGSLTLSDLGLLRRHIPGVVFFKLSDFASSKCPSGACWERILTVAELVKEHYVIQLDGDTLALGDLDEVLHCILTDTSFTLGTADNQAIDEMLKCADVAKAAITDQRPHIQILAESNFDKVRDCFKMHYVRGCAGFAGFSKGSFSREFVENLSSEMEIIIGSRWNEWGTEQVMSNLVIANSRSIVLPHPKYSSCEELHRTVPSFIHFIGYCRFNGGAYARYGRAAIRALG